MAADASQYILSFNFDETVRQIAELEAAYSQLTSVFEKQSLSASGRLQDIESKLTSISTSLDSSMGKLNRFYNEFFLKLSKTNDYFKQIEGSAKSLNLTLQSIGGFDPGKAPTGGSPVGKGVGFSFTAGGENEEDLMHNLRMAELAAKSAREAIELSKKAESSWAKTAKSIGNKIHSEFSGAFSKIKGMFSGFTAGAVGGGVLLSMLGLMALGVQELQRKGAERGEMANAFEGFGELYTKEGQRAVNAWSDFQEHAQWQWGVGRKEIQGVVNTIRNSGFKDIVDKNLGSPMQMAEKNAAALTIKLDSLLNQASGTAAKQAIQISETMGNSFDTSTQKLLKLSSEAKASGMNFEKFTQTVLDGSSAMMQYRIDVTEVAEILRKVKKHYEDMGLSSQQAGALASTVTQGLTSAVGGTRGFDEIFAMEFFQKRGINNLSGIEAKQKMMEEFQNASEEESSGLAIDRVKYAVQLAKSRTHGRAEALLMLRTLGYEGPGVAEAAYDRAESFDTSAGLPEEDKSLMKEFKKAFQTQGSTLTDLQTIQRDLIAGLAKIGEGILGIAANLLAVIVLGIRSLPGQLASYFTILNPLSKDEDVKKAEAVLLKMNNILGTHWTEMSKNMDKLSSGWETVKKTIPGLEDAIDPFNAVSKAFTEDIGTVTWTTAFREFSDKLDYFVAFYENSLESMYNQMNYLTDRVQELTTGLDGSQTAEQRYEARQGEIDAALISARNESVKGVGKTTLSFSAPDFAKASHLQDVNRVSPDQ
jgi:uncharacterized coiled-coil protein SlyX